MDAGILERRQYQASPPRHDYHLTAAGRELVPVMHALRDWVTSGPSVNRRCGPNTTATRSTRTWPAQPAASPSAGRTSSSSPPRPAGTSPARSSRQKHPARNPQPPPRAPGVQHANSERTAASSRSDDSCHPALGQTVLAADQGRQPTLEPQAGRRSEPRSTDLRGQRLDELGVGPSAE